MKKVLLLTVLILLLSSVYLFSAVPCKINYQGRLIKDNVPVDGTKTMKFSIYDSAVGGNELWTSGDVNITVHNGLFRYVIGEGFVGGNPVADLSSINWTAGETLYLEVKVETDILTPREAIYAYPYAINSHLLEGKTKEYFLDTSADVQTKQGNLNIMGNVGIGTAGPLAGAKLEVYRNAVNSILLVHQDSGTQTASLWLRRGTQDWEINNVGRLDFVYEDAKKVTIDTNGNVGIGTTGPNDKLEISNGAVRFGVGNYKTGSVEKGRIFIDNSQTISGFSNDAWIFEKSDGNSTNPDSPIAFVTVGSDDVVNPRLVIQGSGNVGIGTTSPGAKLEVAGNFRATGGIEPDYDSGWVWVDRIGAWGLKTLTHNLNYFPRQIQWWFSNGNPGTFIGPLASNTYKDHSGNPLGIWITLTQVKFSIWHDRYVYRMYNASSQAWSNYNNGYYRILLWK